MSECQNKATHRFTWPGKPESFICSDHLPKLQGLASELGMYFQTSNIHESEFEGETCRQKVKEPSNDL